VKGGSEATVRIASANLVPTDANLLPDYSSFVAYRRDCDAFCERVNARLHSVTRCPPIERLRKNASVSIHCRPNRTQLPSASPARSGRFCRSSTSKGGKYSVPDDFVGQTVWARHQNDEIVIVHVARDGAHEIARREPTVPGQPRHDPAHFGPQAEGPLHRTPRTRTPDEAAFLAIGPGAQQWLISAAAVGAARIRSKMIAAVALAKSTPGLLNAGSCAAGRQRWKSCRSSPLG